MADAVAGVRNASAAVGGYNTPRACLHYVRTWLGAPGGAPTAAAAWAGARFKHTGDYNPPPGVPVYFAPNHVALSIGGGNIVSTDWPRVGRTGVTTIRDLETSWRHPYLGWAGDVNGVKIANVGSSASVTAATTATNALHIPVPKIPGLPGLPSIPNPLDIPKAAAGQMRDVYNALVSVAKIAEFFANPANWLRVAMFVVGWWALMWGLLMLVRGQGAAQSVKSTAQATARVVSRTTKAVQ